MIVTPWRTTAGANQLSPKGLCQENRFPQTTFLAKVVHHASGTLWKVYVPTSFAFPPVDDTPPAFER